tara:strand:- start:42442 stop:43332 length:891 start_codon:yes stop_codon:yes gene_type:complete
MTNATEGTQPSAQSLKRYMQFKSYAFMYEKLFETRFATTDEDREQAFQVRYEVYCAEYGFEEAQKFSDKMEQDAFDQQAQHALLIHKPSQRTVGTVRIIPPNMRDLGLSFPLQEAFQCSQLANPDNVKRMCEISRLCILKDFRGKSSFASKKNEEEEKTARDKICDVLASKLIKLGPIGLLRSCYEMSLNRKLDSACAVLETRLIRSLERLGIVCERIGPVIDYHGKRQPIIIDFMSTANSMRSQNKAIWEMITYGGRLQQRGNLVREHNNLIGAAFTETFLNEDTVRQTPSALVL